MANEVDKFGIKFWLIIDVNSKYVLNSYQYLDKDKGRQTDLQLRENVVLKILQLPYLNSRLNVAIDNIFTFVKLADKLSEKKITIVGTMHLNKK